MADQPRSSSPAQSFFGRMRGLTQTLTFRIVAISSIWAIIALVVIATVITALFRQVSHRGFETVLSAHLFNLIASVNASEDGWISGVPNLGDLRFSEPLSGWYWTVEPVSTAITNTLRSSSLAGHKTPAADPTVPFDPNYRRQYLTIGPGEEQIEVLEAEVVLGQGDRIVRFRVMGNRSELEEEIAGFTRRLLAYLALFGAGMVIINVVAILLALKPLNGIRVALSNIRAGTAEQLAGPFPAEIAPLAEETNALIESNRRIIERSRKQVGNLAHSLKTPLAVIMNEGRAMAGPRGDLISNQATAMRSQIDHYLQRARAAAQSSSLSVRTDVNDTLARLARVIAKVAADKELTINVPERKVIFAGEKEDLEEIVGNLLENAAKWAERQIAVTLSTPEPKGERRFLRIVIEDDGPGIPDHQARQALKRGRRLDETKQGTGLGLAIVADLVEEYGGTLSLGKSTLGGLRAEVDLRIA
jgi:signal transduction histidine kinase